MVGLSSLSRGLISKINERRGKVAILELDEFDQPKGDAFVFQYFPETLTDTAQIQYQNRDIPGNSLPLLQYLSGGPRVISFQAVFTTDLDLGDPDVAASVNDSRLVPRNVDIRTVLAIIQSWRLPAYVGGRTLPPPKLIVNIQNSGIGIAGGSSVGGNDSVLAVLSQLEVHYESFFPSNVPRVVTVNMSFNQIAQFQGSVYMPQFDQKMADYRAGRGPGLPYKIQFDSKGSSLIKESVKKPGT